MGWFGGRHEAKLDTLTERQARLEQALDRVSESVAQIQAALVVRDPGNALSAEAYDGLRKSVLAGAGQRRAHLVQLAELTIALDRGASSDHMRSMVEEWGLQAGLTAIHDPDRPELYDVLDGGSGALKVLSPAWLDGENGALIRRGTATRQGATDDHAEGTPAEEQP